MKLERDAINAAVREKVIAPANELGEEANNIGDDDIIPAPGALDSAAIRGLMVWYEETDGRPHRQGGITIDNLGSINAMADALRARKSG